MHNVLNKLTVSFTWMMQIVNWNDLLHRVFRPVIHVNSVALQPVRVDQRSSFPVAGKPFPQSNSGI